MSYPPPPPPYPPTPIAATDTPVDTEITEIKSRRTYTFQFKVEMVRKYLKREKEGLSANAFVRCENEKVTTKADEISRSVFLTWLKDVDVMVVACQEDLDVSELKKRKRASRKETEKPPKPPPKKSKPDGPVSRKAYIFSFKVRFVRRYLETKEIWLAAGNNLTRQGYLDAQDEDVDLSAFKRWITDAEILEAVEANDDELLLNYVRRPRRPELIPHRVVEEPLEQWIERTNGELCKEGKALTIVEVKKKALELAAIMIPEETKKNFAASDGWVHRFFDANGIVDHTLHGADIVTDKAALTALSNAYYYCKENKYDGLKNRIRALRNELSTLQKQAKATAAEQKTKNDGNVNDIAGEETVGAQDELDTSGSI
jgi:hypothetical protein